jgi:hypothetical protein
LTITTKIVKKTRLNLYFSNTNSVYNETEISFRLFKFDTGSFYYIDQETDMNKLKTCILFSSLTLTMNAAIAGPWVQCGTLSNFSSTTTGQGTCNFQHTNLTLADPNKTEYAIQYATGEPVPIVCTGWNSGARIANKQPFLVSSDNPPAGMLYGGFVFYRSSQAADECAYPNWRHRYWASGVNGAITTNWFPSNGCHGTGLPVYCRAR